MYGMSTPGIVLRPSQMGVTIHFTSHQPIHPRRKGKYVTDNACSYRSLRLSLLLSLLLYVPPPISLLHSFGYWTVTFYILNLKVIKFQVHLYKKTKAFFLVTFHLIFPACPQPVNRDSKYVHDSDTVWIDWNHCCRNYRNYRNYNKHYLLLCGWYLAVGPAQLQLHSFKLFICASWSKLARITNN